MELKSGEGTVVGAGFNRVMDRLCNMSFEQQPQLRLN